MSRARPVLIAALIAAGALLALRAVLRAPAAGVAFDAPEPAARDTTSARAESAASPAPPGPEPASSLARRPASAPEPARVLGRVTPPPEEGLRAYAIDAQGASAASARVEADGRFELDALPAAEPLRVLVLTDFRGPLGPAGTRARDADRRERLVLGGLRRAEQALVLDPGEARAVVLELEPPCALEGRLLDARGLGVAGARLVAWLAEPADRLQAAASADARTDAGGAFRVDGLGAGAYVLEARPRNGPPQRYELAPLAPGETRAGLELRLTAGLALAGVVRLPDGSPAAGAKVGLEQRGVALRAVETDAEGRFRFEHLNEAECAVGALLCPKPYGVRLVAFARATPGEGELTLRLNAEQTLAGVVRVGGAPVSSSLHIELEPAEPRPRVPSTEAFTLHVHNPVGRFSTSGLLPGRWRLELKAEGFAKLERELDVPGPALELELVRSARLSGVVVDARGAPVARALVVAWPADGEGTALGAARADDEGRFRALEAPPGAVELRARRDAEAAGPPLRLELAPGEEREGLELRLR